MPWPKQLVALAPVELQHTLGDMAPRENRQRKVSYDACGVVSGIYDEHIELAFVEAAANVPSVPQPTGDASCPGVLVVVAAPTESLNIQTAFVQRGDQMCGLLGNRPPHTSVRQAHEHSHSVVTPRSRT